MVQLWTYTMTHPLVGGAQAQRPPMSRCSMQASVSADVGIEVVIT
jgi:hypothetical protein